MKKIGLIGGLDWESTVLYCEHINTLAHDVSSHCAKIILHGVDVQEAALPGLIEKARQVERSGADCLLFCSDAAYEFAGEVQNALSIPLLHIADAAAERIETRGVRKVALLGAKHTLEQAFYQEKLFQHGIESILPAEEELDFIQHIISYELTKGVTSRFSKQRLQETVRRLTDRGAQGIVLGSPRLSLLLSEDDTDLPVFDTAYLHAEQAVQFALTPLQKSVASL